MLAAPSLTTSYYIGRTPELEFRAIGFYEVGPEWLPLRLKLRHILDRWCVARIIARRAAAGRRQP